MDHRERGSKQYGVAGDDMRKKTPGQRVPHGREPEEAIPEALVDEGLVQEAERRVSETEGRVPFEDVRRRLGL